MRRMSLKGRKRMMRGGPVEFTAVAQTPALQALPDGTLPDQRLVGIRRREAGPERHTVGSQKALGKWY